MSEKSLSNKKVAVLVANGFAENAMTEIQRSLLSVGAVIKVISTEQGLVNSWNGEGWGHCFPIDAHVGETLSVDFDLLIIPGGERSVAKLKSNPHTERILTGFLEAGKPVALMSDAVELVAQSEMVIDVTVTGSDASKDVIIAAGGKWAEQAIFVDGSVLSGTVDEDDALSGYIERMVAFFSGADVVASDVEVKQAA